MKPDITVTEIVKSPLYGLLNFFGLINKSLEDNPNTPQAELKKSIGYTTIIKTYDEDSFVTAIHHNPERIRCIVNPKELWQNVAVLADWKVIAKIENPLRTTQLAAIEGSPEAIKLISNPIQDLEFAALSNHGIAAMQFINNPKEQHYIEALEAHPYDIRLIENPSSTLRKKAIGASLGYAIQYIKNPTDEEIKIAVYSTELPEVIGKEVLTNNQNLSDEMKIFLVQNSFSNIEYINTNQKEILEKAGYIFNTGDINSIPNKINNISLSEEQRQSLLEGKPVTMNWDNHGPYIDGDSLTIYFDEIYDTLKIYKQDVRNEGGSINFYNSTINVLKSETNMQDVSIENKPIVGKLKFHDSGEIISYKSDEKFLEDLKKELNHNPYGFSHETVKREPELLKKIDDIICGHVGMDNPYSINYYIDLVQPKENIDPDKNPLYNHDGNELTDFSTTTQKFDYDMKACAERIADKNEQEVISHNRIKL